MKSFIVLVALLDTIHGANQLIDSDVDPMSDEMIIKINTLGTTWKVS